MRRAGFGRLAAAARALGSTQDTMTREHSQGETTTTQDTQIGQIEKRAKRDEGIVAAHHSPSNSSSPGRSNALATAGTDNAAALDSTARRVTELGACSAAVPTKSESIVFCERSREAHKRAPIPFSVLHTPPSRRAAAHARRRVDAHRTAGQVHSGAPRAP